VDEKGKGEGGRRIWGGVNGKVQTGFIHDMGFLGLGSCCWWGEGQDLDDMLLRVAEATVEVVRNRHSLEAVWLLTGTDPKVKTGRMPSGECLGSGVTGKGTGAGG